MNIHISNLSKSYAKGNISIFSSLSFKINSGESTAIIGESGRGKTSLLYLLSGLDSADYGEIIIDNIDIAKLTDEQITTFRGEYFGFIFQHHFLLNDLDALENTLLPLRILGKLTKKNQEYVLSLFDYFDLSNRISHFPDELSGGEKQRVAAIRALAHKPEVIFADEPTGSLDKENADKLQKLLLNLCNQQKMTLVVSTHNLEFAKQCKNCYSIDDLES